MVSREVEQVRASCGEDGGDGASGDAEAAATRAADLAPVITELRASGATSLRAIASALNDRGIPTARGGKWFAASVRDVLARI